MEFNTSGLNPEQLNVFNAIYNAPDGITMKSLLLQLGREESYKRTVSDIISDLISVHSIPIGSSSSLEKHKFGYFIMRTPADYSLGIHTLESRAEAVNKRIVKIKEIKSKNRNEDK